MLNIKKILFPTDFSECADAALGWALVLAKNFEAKLEMLHISTPDKIDHDQQLMANFPTFDACVELLLEFADSKLDRTIEDSDLVEINHTTRYSANPAETITRYAEEAGIDLIVMGTHGRKGLSHMLMGSVAGELVSTAPCPIMTIRQQKEATKDVHRILLPIDFSDASKVAARYGGVLAKITGARLHVVHVLPPEQDIENGQRQEAEEKVRDFMSKCQVMINFEVHIEQGKESRKIVDVADNEDNTLIIMASHGENKVDLNMLGSTSYRVVRSAHNPVLIVKINERQFVK
jgi:nucleotide-binding universal stress UspA family protein